MRLSRHAGGTWEYVEDSDPDSSLDQSMRLSQHAGDDTWEDIEPGDSDANSSLVQSGATSLPSLRQRRARIKRRAPNTVAHFRERTQFNLARPKDKAKSDSPRKPPQDSFRKPERTNFVYTAPKKQGKSAQKSGSMGVGEYLLALLNTTCRIMGAFLQFLKIPISILIIFYVSLLASVFVFPQLQASFTPLCIVPGMLFTPLCVSGRNTKATPGTPQPQWANFTRLAEAQERTFGWLLEERAGGLALALEIKQAEMATTDLLIALEHSDMHGKEIMVEHLRGFVYAAKRTAQGLQRFSAQVGGAVDLIIAVNNYAMHSIEAAEAKASEHSILPWRSPFSAEATVVKHFETAMGVISEQLKRLILEAEVALGDLSALEERLDTLHSIAQREDIAIQAEKDELLTALITLLGGNRRLERNRRILADLAAYRRAARAHVTGALQTLLGMQAEIEDLRERAAAPELAGDHVPVHVHIRSIQHGIERLRNSEVRSRLNKDRVTQKIPDDDR